MATHEYVKLKRSDLIAALRDLNEIVVSLDRIGSAFADDKPGLGDELERFIVERKVFRKLAKMRNTLSTPFSDEIVGDAEETELEQLMKGVRYWKSSPR